MKTRNLNKQIFLSLLLIMLSLGIHAQGPNFGWVNEICSSQSSMGRSIHADPDDNVIVIGDFIGTLDADPGPGVFNLTSQGGNDVFIQKLDTDGDLIWAKSIGNAGAEYGYSVTTDKIGNIYIAGIFIGSVDFDPGPGVNMLVNPNGFFNGFTLKLDTNGNFLWVVNFDGPESMEMFEVNTDDVNNIYLTGEFFGTLDLDPGPSSHPVVSLGEADMFLVKLDENGSFKWGHSAGGVNNEQSAGMTLDNLANIYITGSFESSMDFDWGPSTHMASPIGNSTISDVFVMKIDSSGSVIWVNTFGGMNAQVGRDIVCDNQANIYFVGMFNETVDFDPGPGIFELTAGAIADFYVEKMDSSGNFVWVRSLETYSPFDELFAICIDNNSDLYVSNAFNATVDFDPGSGSNIMTSNGDHDIFLSKVDQNGNFLWTMQAGAGSYDVPRSLASDSEGGIYLTGLYLNTVDFNPYSATANLSCQGGFVLKMQNSMLNLPEQDFFDKVSIFPNPSNVGTSIQINGATDIEELRIDIISAEGRLIQKNLFIQENNTLNMVDLPVGLYNICLRSLKNQRTLKLLIK